MGRGCDEKDEAKKVPQTVSRRVGRSGSSEVRGISVRLWEPSLKNPNHFLSELLPSLSLSLSITTSAFSLPCHTPSSLFPTYFSLIHPKDCTSRPSRSESKNSGVVELVQICLKCSDTLGEGGGGLNRLPDVTVCHRACCGSWMKFPAAPQVTHLIQREGNIWEFKPRLPNQQIKAKKQQKKDSLTSRKTI